MPNRLIDETSPYLLQHAHNPVAWYPWGEEAFQKAQSEDKPVLVSIGYSACHWCHVMERESFEDPAIAEIMNENFVSIKVDREERPDVDGIYMTAVQALTGSGGWPLTVFLTPEGKPFYGGTYFPPDDSRGMTGFPRVLLGIAEAYRNRRGDVVSATQQLVNYIQQVNTARRSVDPLTPDTLHQAYQVLAQSYDFENGGFGSAPKFPQPMNYEFLLHYAHLSGSTRASQMVEMALDGMAMGGIYDQVGGGFHRYSTDAGWLVPHFEKMLYDNALLVRLYLHGYQATGRPLYRRIAEETLDYVLREMTDQGGGFYSAQDADSEREEGKFFIWTPGELEGVLGRDDGSLLARYFGATEQGNFEGKNILHVPESPEEFAPAASLGVDEIEALLARAKPLLLEARGHRVAPARDDKVLSGWNGLMMHGFAEAAQVLGRPEYARAAESCAEFLLDRMHVDGRLQRTYKDGRAALKGYLEDYAFVGGGLLSVYESTFDSRWLRESQGLADRMLALFWDEGQGAFFDTGSDHETLIVRPRDVFDNATPSGNSAAVELLLRLGLITGDSGYTNRAAAVLRSVHEDLARVPFGMGNWLCALDFYLSTPREIVVVGKREEEGTRALLDVVHGRYMPNKVVAGWDLSVSAPRPDDFPLLRGREAVGGRPTAYVCKNYVCQLPVNEPEALARQLDG